MWDESWLSFLHSIVTSISERIPKQVPQCNWTRYLWRDTNKSITRNRKVANIFWPIIFKEFKWLLWNTLPQEFPQTAYSSQFFVQWAPPSSINRHSVCRPQVRSVAKTAPPPPPTPTPRPAAFKTSFSSRTLHRTDPRSLCAGWFQEL